jgi:hypothetical protein
VETSQAAFDIAHQRRGERFRPSCDKYHQASGEVHAVIHLACPPAAAEAKLKEVDQHLAINRQLLLSMTHMIHACVWWVSECFPEDDPKSRVQAIGKQISQHFIADGGTDGMWAKAADVWMNERTNPFNTGDGAISHYFHQPPQFEGGLGYAVSMAPCMYGKHIPEELVRRPPPHLHFGSWSRV